MDYQSSTNVDKIVAITFLLILPLSAIFYGSMNQMMFVAGIPYIIYGMIGLSTKKVWLMTRGIAVDNHFFHGDKTNKICFVYIILGIVVSAIFFFMDLAFKSLMASV